MSRKILLSEAAKADLASIGRYTQEMWGVKKRDLYLKKIFQCFNQLVLSPLSGKLRPELYKGIRSICVEKHVVYYFHTSKAIQIVAILHEKMEPNNRLI